MRDVYLDCFSGIAGDMLVGALLDAGASFEAVRDGLARLGVGGYRLECRRVRRGAISATKFEVILGDHDGADPGAVEMPCGDERRHGHAHGHGAEHRVHGDPHHRHHHDPDDGHQHGHDHHHDPDDDHGHDHRHGHDSTDAAHPHPPARGLREIRAIIESADLPVRVRQRSMAAFTLLAEAEGRVHGMPAEDVHFHEVGAVDAICDIVGACLALESLEVDRVFVGPLRVGSGFVECAHGKMPVPAPGALGCLAGFDVRFEQGRGELVTPTGACLLGALATPRVPAEFVVECVGHGAGTRDPADVPNVVRAVLGRAERAAGETLVEISTNLDHLPPTQVAVAVEAALAAGAVEAFTVPCTMKKGRPGHLVVALAPDAARAAVEDAIFRETGTLGLRRRVVERTVLARHLETVSTPWGDVRIKVGTYAGTDTSVVPEFEDCRALAAARGVPVAQVLDAARRAFRGPQAG